MGNYTCHAINQMIGGRQSADQESFMVYVQNEGMYQLFLKAFSMYFFNALNLICVPMIKGDSKLFIFIIESSISYTKT